MLKKAYYYLFYKLYSWAYNLHNGRYFPEQTSMYTLAFFAFLNFINFTLFIKLCTGYTIFKLHSSKIEVITIGAVIMAFHYFLFLYNKRFLKIISIFKNESKKNKTIGTILTWLYIMFTIAFGVILLEILK